MKTFKLSSKLLWIFIILLLPCYNDFYTILLTPIQILMASMYGLSRQELDFMWNYKDYIYVISNFIISIVAIIYLVRLLYLLFICLKCDSYTINIKKICSKEYYWVLLGGCIYFVNALQVFSNYKFFRLAFDEKFNLNLYCIRDLSISIYLPIFIYFSAVCYILYRNNKNDW